VLLAFYDYSAGHDLDTGHELLTGRRGAAVPLIPWSVRP
jgi:hypothetical protein